MTMLGRHTVEETRALGKAIAYQFATVDDGYKAISPNWISAHKAEYDALTADWAKASKEWHIDYEKVLAKLALIMAPMGIATPESIVPSEDQYNTLLSHTAQGGRNGPDSLYDCGHRVEAALGRKLDYSGQPSQLDTTDVDMGTLKAADAAKKSTESGFKQAAPYVAGGLFVLGVGYALTKKYL